MRISSLLFCSAAGLLLISSVPASASPNGGGPVVGRYRAFHQNHGTTFGPRNRNTIRRPAIQPVHWKKVRLPHGLGKVGQLPKSLPHGASKGHIRKYFPHGPPKLPKKPKKLPNGLGKVGDIKIKLPHGLGNTGNAPRRFMPEWW